LNFRKGKAADGGGLVPCIVEAFQEFFEKG